MWVGMKYKFEVMVDLTLDLESEIQKFNEENNTDLKRLSSIDEEVNFAELETSMSDELLIKFGVQLGAQSSKSYYECSLEYQKPSTISSIPATISELEEWMRENCYNFTGYSINGNVIFEGFGIEKLGDQFSWYYTERGKKDTIRFFALESEVVEYAFNQIKDDKWASANCIGFSPNKVVIIELEAELQKNNIQSFGDSIPYYCDGRPAYRLFVSGRDFRKAEYIKEKFGEVKKVDQ